MVGLSGTPEAAILFLSSQIFFWNSSVKKQSWLQSDLWRMRLRPRHLHSVLLQVMEWPSNPRIRHDKEEEKFVPKRLSREPVRSLCIRHHEFNFVLLSSGVSSKYADHFPSHKRLLIHFSSEHFDNGSYKHLATVSQSEWSNTARNSNSDLNVGTKIKFGRECPRKKKYFSTVTNVCRALYNRQK